jgi:hypothetical protein
MAHDENGRGVERDTYVDVLSAKEGRALFDRRARLELGISGDEFLRRWDAGLYRPVPDTPEGRKIGRLVMLMPFAGRSIP